MNYLVTGGNGFLGQHIVKELISRGVSRRDIYVPRSKFNDLTDFNQCLDVVRDMNVVIHAAGNVGGIDYNKRSPGELIRDNALMGINMIEAFKECCSFGRAIDSLSSSVEFSFTKFVLVGTTCSYPKFAPIPFKEGDLWNGYPEETNAPYGIAKKMLIAMIQAYNKQYNRHDNFYCNFQGVSVIPANLYGPNDNYHEHDSHVIPGMIGKFKEAIEHKLDKVTLWGDGSPTREFLYVTDAARGIVDAASYEGGVSPLNIGSGHEISIKDLAYKISGIMNYKGAIEWDTNKPNGQPRRLLDCSLAEKEINWQPKVSLDKGLRETINGYCS